MQVKFLKKKKKELGNQKDSSRWDCLQLNGVPDQRAGGDNETPMKATCDSG